MKIKLTIFIVLAYLIAGFAQKIDENSPKYIAPKYEKTVGKAAVFIDSVKTSQKIPGLSIAVGVGDKIVWAEGLGTASVELEVPVKINTKFRVGSISKTFTALAICKLKDENRIDLDLPIQTYVPAFPKKDME